MKTIGGFRRTRFIGLERTQLAGYFVAAAYNLVRIARLMQTVAAGHTHTRPAYPPFTQVGGRPTLQRLFPRTTQLPFRF